jgi:hypothetical protein
MSRIVTYILVSVICWEAPNIVTSRTRLDTERITNKRIRYAAIEYLNVRQGTNSSMLMMK